MRTLRLILFLGICVFAAYVKYSTAPGGHAFVTSSHEIEPGADAAATPGVPDKALRVLNIVRTTGRPPEGYVGGRVFQNREGRLPADGSYREFDVDPHEGGRNAERIIVEWDTKKAWYTGDHYETFVPLP